MILKTFSPSKSSQSHQTLGIYHEKSPDFGPSKSGEIHHRIHRLEVHHDLTINNGDLTMGI